MSVLLEQSVSLRRNPVQMFAVRPTEPISPAIENGTCGASAPNFVVRHAGLLRGRKSGTRRHGRVTAVGFGQGTFAGTHRNGQDAPEPDLGGTGFCLSPAIEASALLRTG